MALSNYDIDYLVDVIQPAFDGLGTAYGQLDGIMMHVNFTSNLYFLHFL